ncbi:class F sortase [Phycicoccus duodecadis]|uniref:Sortase family protein n=1 Tax=Phycicoccus duodecadis TaxID=173053 RepID=A0A2N3YIZ4_9MICO|nr:class F sortase [Phycicoccus duodecadis]PKW26813.1 sortase family protein [Phycicoccus duodecadis]
MSISSTFGGRRGVLAAVATVVLLVLGGGLVARALTAPGPPPQPDSSQAVAAPSTPPASARPSPSAAPTEAEAPDPDFGLLMAPSAPVALRIPSIHLATKGLVELGIGTRGELEAPKDFQRAGWYAAGPTPGEFGPSVIAGHVDSTLGPAVFYRLGALEKGAQVMVDRKDGSTATFVVDRVARYPKAHFPTSEVYADTGGRAELRLITCGGDIDRQSGHYLDNVVAYAHLVPGA